MRSRVPDQAVGGRHCIDNDLRNKVRAVAFQCIQVEILNVAFDTLLHREIILRACLEERVERPGWIHKTLILGVRRKVGLSGHNLDHIFGKIGRCLPSLVRVRRGLAQHQANRADEILPRQSSQRTKRHGSVIGSVKCPRNTRKWSTLLFGFFLAGLCVFARFRLTRHFPLLFPFWQVYTVRPFGQTLPAMLIIAIKNC